MIEVKRDDFFVESIKNPIEYGTYYKINSKYGTGFQWTSEVHHDFIITATDIRFNQETMVGEHIGSGYVLALYISGAGDEFYPYQNISPNTLRCYEPSEKYKAIYHPQIPLRCITVQVDQEFIDQYLQEISGDLEVNFSDFFKEKGKFYLPNVNHAMQSLYEYLLSKKASRITVEAKIYEIISYLASYLKEDRLNEENGQPINKTDLQALAELTHYMDEHYSFMQGALQNLAAVIAMRTNVGRMNEILDAPLQTGSEQLTNQGCDIVFDHVGFAYNSGKTVLRDVSFTAKQGEVTALVGPSGGGKTTVSRLAARFWDYQKGSITVGGMEVSRIDPEKLMSLYSIVFQDVTLFDNTILENIRLGRKGATDEEVLAAAKLANCEEFAEKLPDKWNTNIGENGCALSGGERQRISIARAFLKDAPIILLDEATASLDVENETAIQEALSRLIKHKTVLIIAHRMRTVAGADKIVVLSDGVVAEQGAPDALYARNGQYTHMVDLQTESQSWAI